VTHGRLLRPFAFGEGPKMYKHMGVSKKNGFSPKWDFSKVKKQNEQLAVQDSMTTPSSPH